MCCALCAGVTYTTGVFGFELVGLWCGWVCVDVCSDRLVSEFPGMVV